MKKLNCSNCGSLNFESVRISYNCRKPTTPLTREQAGQNKPVKDCKPKAPEGGSILAKIMAIVVLIACGGGVYFYLHDKKVKEQKAQEDKEIAKFTSKSILADEGSIQNELKSLPERFQVRPPDLRFLSNFPFSQKTIGIGKPVVIQDTQPQVRTFVTDPNGLNGREIRSKSQDMHTPEYHTRILNILNVQRYEYRKNEQKELVCEAFGEFELQYIAFNPKSGLPNAKKPYVEYADCANTDSSGDCVNTNKIKGTGSITLVWRNSAWEFDQMGAAESQYIHASWSKAGDPTVAETISKSKFKH